MTKFSIPTLASFLTARARLPMMVSITCRASRSPSISPTKSISCERTTTSEALPMVLASFAGGVPRSLPSVISTTSGTLALSNFSRSVSPGMAVPSMLAASFPLWSTTEKLDEAPGKRAAMPMGVMEGKAASAGRTVRSLAPCSCCASSTAISKRMASTKK
jgi:hypothetical protein